MKTVMNRIISYFEYLAKARLATYYCRQGQYEKAKQVMQE